MTLAARSLPSAEVKPVGVPLLAVDEAGVFEGYASLFGIEDLGRDIVAPGAFRRTLGRRGPGGVRMLFQHDPAKPIGVWERMHEDARGLFVRGRLTLAAFHAREVHSLMKAGAIDGLSIGFRSVRSETDRRTGVRRLTEIDLWEISIVTFPMQPAARISDVKSQSVPRAILASSVGDRPIGAKLAEASHLLQLPNVRRRGRPGDLALSSHRHPAGRTPLNAH